mmetsp:Transcript_16632/g.29599  ORF Transcript_16632/g.29599 Transcript_16632/m.29599 type:complete len:176 (-) Transcript_16632:762-1289(-)
MVVGAHPHTLTAQASCKSTLIGQLALPDIHTVPLLPAFGAAGRSGAASNSSSSTTFSVVKKYVNRAPTMHTTPQPASTDSRPNSCSHGEKATTPMTAPSFPAAAEIPWQVARMSVGYTSAGSTNVVVFGPKFEKRKVKPKHISIHHLITPAKRTSLQLSSEIKKKFTAMATKPQN